MASDDRLSRRIEKGNRVTLCIGSHNLLVHELGCKRGSDEVDESNVFAPGFLYCEFLNVRERVEIKVVLPACKKLDSR